MKKAKKYSLLGFWRAVLIRSISTLGQLGNILTVIAYISIFWLTLVNIGLLEDIIQQTIENLISWAASIWLVFLIMVITPYSLWKEVSKDRDKLIDIKNYEKILDQISILLDKGNNDILNKTLSNYEQYLEWKSKWSAWQIEVEDYLGKNLSLSEKNMFRNNVLVTSHNLPGLPNTSHSFERSIVANQLKTLKNLIVRYRNRIQ